MIADRRGLPVTSESEIAVRHLDDAVEALAGHRCDTAQRIAAATSADPDLVLANCLRGFALKLLARSELDSGATAALAAARSAAQRRGATPREALHIAALDAWCGGEMERAGALLEAILAEHPLDLLAFKLHHAVF